MTREAFDLSERFHVPVVLRLVTRLAHSRAPDPTRATRYRRTRFVLDPDKNRWILLPSLLAPPVARPLDQQAEIRAFTESSPYNTLDLNPGNRELGVITTGIARNYYLENAGRSRLSARPTCTSAPIPPPWRRSAYAGRPT